MKRKKELGEFWQAYLATLPSSSEPPPKYPDAWSFCDNEVDANKLGDLVIAGIKTATSSLIWAYEAEKEPLPRMGDLSIITNWDGEPLCIIETIEVQTIPFNEVDDRLAYDEGEGDRSLPYWRRVHWEAFSRECSTISREPAETMPVLCERFQVLFINPSINTQTQ